MDVRLGLTIPALPLSVRESCALAREAEALGYTDAWTMESGGTDGFSVATALGVSTERLRIGTAIVPVYTRPPALLAMSAMTAAQACDGRFCLGLGASSETIVERWMGIPYERPVVRIRETLDVLDRAFAGEKVNFEGETVRVHGFRMEQTPQQRVPIFLAALGPRMRRLAVERGDGIALFFMNEEGVRLTAKEAPDLELMARVMCFVDEPIDDVRNMARWLLTPYATVPGYNAFLRAQGLEAEADAIATAWAAGDRKGAGAAVSDRMIDELVVHGSAQDCKDRITSFREAGLHTPVLMFLTTRGPEAIRSAVATLAP